MWPVKTILCPTDFAETSEATLRAAYQLARDRNARLVALHVAPKSVVKHVETVSELAPEQARAKLWEAIRRPRPEEAELNVDHRLEEGDPAQGILRVAEQTGCELIVMGLHDKSGWTRWLTGGVAETVIQKAPCSVLIVKAPRTAEPGHGAVETPPERAQTRREAVEDPRERKIGKDVPELQEATAVKAAPARTETGMIAP
jgi:nucleotide-binding universal stress UspA family protein